MPTQSRRRKAEATKETRRQSTVEGGREGKEAKQEDEYSVEQEKADRPMDLFYIGEAHTHTHTLISRHSKALVVSLYLSIFHSSFHPCYYYLRFPKQTKHTKERKHKKRVGGRRGGCTFFFYLFI